MKILNQRIESKRQQARHQRGIAVIEMALGIVVLALLLGALMPWYLKSTDSAKAKNTADTLTQFRAAASSHFQANRKAYIAAMTDGTDADKLCLVNANPTTGLGGTNTYDATLHRCAVDANFLKFVSALPVNAPVNNAYSERWVAVFKLVYDKQVPPVPTGGVEMLVVSATVDNTKPVVAADARRYDTALTAASYVAGQGGVVPDADRSTCVASRATNTYQACGAGWRYNLSDFLTSAEITAFSQRLSN